MGISGSMSRNFSGKIYGNSRGFGMFLRSNHPEREEIGVVPGQMSGWKNAMQGKLFWIKPGIYH